MSNDNGIVFGCDDTDEERALARLLTVSHRWATRTQMLAALRASRCDGATLSLLTRSILVCGCYSNAAIIQLVVAGFERVELTPTAYELTQERAESIDTDESKSARRSFVARVHGDDKAESEMREHDTALKWCAIRLAETQYRRTHATVETVDGPCLSG
jgi:hypothetical protein